MTEQNAPLNREELLTLVDSLHEAATQYYHAAGHESSMTDAQFDSGIELLRATQDSGVYNDVFVHDSVAEQLLEGSPALGTVPQSSKVVEHAHPMLSLNKAKTQEALEKYVAKAADYGIDTFKLQAKLDGLAMTAVYVDGTLVQLARRGDGYRGDDTTFAVDDAQLTLKHLPKTIQKDGRFEVRGELFFTETDFQAADAAREQTTGERFKNSRNAASGVLMRSESGLAYPASLSFVVYAVIDANTFVTLDTLDTVSEAFVSADAVTKTILGEVEGTNIDPGDIVSTIHAFGDQRKQSEYPTDGVVVKPQDEMTHYATMGISAHAPASQIAWKYAAEQSQTVVREVSVTVGKSGRLTPVAHVEPVELDGSTVENASLHNYHLVYEKDIRVGSIVAIEKANDIIPQILHVIQHTEGSERIMPPSECPVCGSVVKSLDGQGIPLKSVLCENIGCTSRVLFVLQNAASKSRLDLDRLSEVSLEFLHSEGILSTVADFYSLTQDVLANSRLGYSATGTPRRMGESTADHVLRHIEASKTAPFDRLLAALGIPNIGVRMSRILQEHFDTFDALRSSSVAELSSIDGIGEITAEKLLEGLKQNADTIEGMRSAGVVFEIPEKTVTVADSPVAGLSFSISGSVPEGFENRQALVDWLEQHGGVFHSSPKKTTDVLIGDPSGTSSKIKKAVSNGVDVMLPETFVERFM